MEDAVFITGYVNGNEKNWAEYYNKNKAPGSKLSAEQALENADTFRPSDKREITIDDAKAIMGYINGDYILPIKEF